MLERLAKITTRQYRYLLQIKILAITRKHTFTLKITWLKYLNWIKLHIRAVLGTTADWGIMRQNYSCAGTTFTCWSYTNIALWPGFEESLVLVLNYFNTLQYGTVVLMALQARQSSELGPESERFTTTKEKRLVTLKHTVQKFIRF